MASKFWIFFHFSASLLSAIIPQLKILNLELIPSILTFHNLDMQVHPAQLWCWIMLLLTNCEVHTGKHSDRGFEVRTERKAEVRIFSRMARTNWSIRALLYSHNQRPKTEAFFKFSTEHICVFLECSCCKGHFFNSHILFKVKLSIKRSKSCVKIFVIPLFVCRRSSHSNTPFCVSIGLWTDS